MTNKTSLLDTDLSEIKEIAEAIRQFSDLADALARSGLSQRAMLVLIKDCSGVPQKQIKKVLDALPTLKKIYLNDAISKN